MIKGSMKQLIDKLPYIKKLHQELERRKERIKQCKIRIEKCNEEQEGLKKKLAEYETAYNMEFPPGHFHSPTVSSAEVETMERDLFSARSDKIPALSLYEEEQMHFLNGARKYYKEIPFTEKRQDHLRYYYDNDFFSYSDAIFLYLIIRYFRPKRIIEVGSGFSSCVMLDTNEIFLQNSIELTFIEPHPERLFSLLKETDKTSTRIIADKMQNIDIQIFDSLVENDILFVDSSHVSKAGSDVNDILFKVLPRLKKGVLIHFHDIFFPFEYPREWILRRGWNEAYILRSFLMYNNTFGIIAFANFLQYMHEEWLKSNMPLCLRNTASSIWIQKKEDR